MTTNGDFNHFGADHKEYEKRLLRRQNPRSQPIEKVLSFYLLFKLSKIIQHLNNLYHMGVNVTLFVEMNGTFLLFNLQSIDF